MITPRRMIKHAVIDIEALGLRPGCPVMEVGLVLFDHDFQVITERSWWMDWRKQSRLKVCESTRQWWEKQLPAVRVILEKPRDGQDEIDPRQFRHRLYEALEGDDAYVWGKGPTYDMALLDEMMRVHGGFTPWKYYRERCVRTFCAGVEEPPFAGAPHVALDDARHEYSWMREAEERFPGSLARQAHRVWRQPV